MKNFISGVEEKYDKRLLEGRLTVEGNVIGCIYNDPLMLDELELSTKDFITEDGVFYFSLAKQLRKAGYSVFDEVTILSSINDTVLSAFEERGGYKTIKNLTDIINIKNADVYLDNLYRENIILGLYRDGFNLFQPTEWNGKEIIPINLFRRMDSEGVLDWYESRLNGYTGGYSKNVTEEEMVEITDTFIDDLASGAENGVDFSTAGDDINLQEMRCYPFLSSAISGFMPSTFNLLAGFSSSGKSTFWIAIVFALIYRGEKVLIISNEQQAKVFKINFLAWLAYKYFRYYGLTKKKMISGEMNDEERKMLDRVAEYFNKYYKGKIKFIGIPDADMSIVKKKIRQSVLVDGFSAVIYDTLKVDYNDKESENSWQSLIKDTRELDTLAKKYNIIMCASMQLASHMIGRLWLNADCLSTSKQTVEVCENLLMIRNVYPEELDPDNKKFYCHPFRMIKNGDRWTEEPIELDKTAAYKFLFLEKTRNGQNSNDSNKVLVYRFNGAAAVCQEQAWARPRHGVIGQG